MSTRVRSTLPAFAVFLAAAALLGWTAYRGVQWLQADWHDIGDARVDAAPAAGSGGEPGERQQVSRIIDAHLFGRPGEAAPEPVVRAPETRLRINLMGLVASSDQAMARAIIDVEGSRTRSYAVGQTIEGTDASVHTVEAQRVLLKRGEAIESLSLKRPGLYSGSQNGAAPSPGEAEGPVEREQTAAQQTDNEFRRQLDGGQMKNPF